MFDKISKKIMHDMSKSELHELILSEEEDFTHGVNEIVERIKDGEEKEQLYNQLNEKCKNDNFMVLVDDMVSPRIAPYEEMRYLREINSNDFSILIKYMLENTIIQCESKEIIKEKTNLSDENIEYSIKLLNSILEWIIVRRYTFERFKQPIFHMFRFDEEKAKILWDSFMDEQQKLTNIVMLENNIICKNIKTDISKLINIFKDLFEDEGESQ